MWIAAQFVVVFALAQATPTLNSPTGEPLPASGAPFEDIPGDSFQAPAQQNDTPAEQNFGTTPQPFMDPPATWNEAPEPPENSVELPSLQFSVTHLPQFDTSGFGTTTFDIRHTWLFGYDEIPPLSITPGAAMHLWSGPNSLDLPPRVYDVYLDLNWRPLDLSRGGVSVSFIPGLYGDFEQIDEHTFQFAGWLMGDYRFGEHASVLAGVAYYRQLQSNWLPVGGVVWTPNDDTRVELLFPQPKLARRFYSDEIRSHWAYVAGQFGGGAWSVTDTPTSTVLVSYSDLRLLLGWEGYSIHGREWRAEIGYVFSRSIGVNNVSLDEPSDTFVAELMFAF